MNKIINLAIGGVVIVAGAALLVTRHKNQPVTVANQTTGQSQQVKTGSNVLVAVDACDVLTQSVATQILGDSATKGDTSAGNAATSDLSVSNCVYTVKINPNIVGPNNTKGVSILARAAKSQAGAASNKAEFKANKPAGVQDVTGIGDAAFFDSRYGQLNVLKGSNWYIVSSYTGNVTTGASLASDQQLAQALQFK